MGRWDYWVCLSTIKLQLRPITVTIGLVQESEMGALTTGNIKKILKTVYPDGEYTVSHLRT
jgi:hypothetical protein